MKHIVRWIVLVLMVIAPVACGGQQAATPSPTAPPTTAPTSIPTIAPTSAPTVAVLEVPTRNLTEGCVTDYNPGIDYFPEKVTLTDSVGWTIEYFNNYKVITVLTPWRDAD
ncbi:MAG: ABC transporter substrate-binding protein, partial [Roseiflexus sp.]